MPKTNSSHVYASAMGAAAAVVLVVVLTIVGELYGPLKTLLKETFSHHWLGKSFLAIGLYLALTFVLSFRKVSRKEAAHALTALWVVSATGALLLFGFFIGHTLHIF